MNNIQQEIITKELFIPWGDGRPEILIPLERELEYSSKSGETINRQNIPIAVYALKGESIDKGCRYLVYEFMGIRV